MRRYVPRDSREHTAGIVDRPTKPEPSAEDRVAEIMRGDANLSRKGAERLVMERYPEHREAFPDRT